MNKTLHRVEDSQGQVLTDPQKILEEIQDFYTKLYQENKQLDKRYIDKLEIPRIPEELKEELKNQLR